MVCFKRKYNFDCFEPHTMEPLRKQHFERIFSIVPKFKILLLIYTPRLTACIALVGL